MLPSKEWVTTMNYGLSATVDAYRPELFWQGEHAALAPAVDHMVDAARAGDDRAFGNLIEVYRSTAERLAQQILHTEEAAADAVQEALIKAHRAMGRFQDGNFRSWFLRIVTNTCYDHLRRQKRRQLCPCSRATAWPSPAQKRNSETMQLRCSVQTGSTRKFWWISPK